MSINYGEIAIKAAKLCREREANEISPRDAWEKIENDMDIEPSEHAAKCAFMRLCAEDWVKDIPPRNFQEVHGESSDHGSGTIEALGCLLRCEAPADKQRLFDAGTVRSYLLSQDSGELDVLIALWNNDDIKRDNPE